MAAVTALVQGRRAVIEGAIADGHPDWTAGLRFDPRRTPLEMITATFTTSWETLSADFYESGTFEMSLDGFPVASRRARPVRRGGGDLDLRRDRAEPRRGGGRLLRRSPVGPPLSERLPSERDDGACLH